MTDFSSKDFAIWFETIHKHKPYPWQKRLVDQILDNQHTNRNAGWPDFLDLPTGSGKTTALDIAIYTQAADPTNAPRRIVYVVDRRAIVNQTTNHVKKLQDSLSNPQTEQQKRISDALKSRMARTSEGFPPLLISELRGGIPLDDAWAAQPDIPAVLISTVDQVGSKLLFRAYGISPKMRPIHAGLLGNDCLWLLDEVHLSKPFAQTLKELQTMSRQCIRGDLPIRNALVQMSATPVDNTLNTFKLDKDKDIEACPLLKKRLNAVKHASLKELTLQGAKRAEDVLIKQIPEEAQKLPGNVIAVIVNRVETAVKTAKKISLLQPDVPVITLTGRIRPLEREEIWKKVENYARAGRDRSQDKRVYIVSTQTIEAGADLDFDAMITEIASMDALIQRAGRVDRRGALSSSQTPAQILIVAAKQQTNKNFIDPVYGETLTHTWNLLFKRHNHNEFNIGPSSTDLGNENERLEASTPQIKTTRLSEHHLDALCQTSPEPVTQPEVAYHLHGVQEPRPEINLIWRAELPLRWTSPKNPKITISHSNLNNLVEQLLLCPPRSTEAIALPLPAFIKWAQDQSYDSRTHFEKPSSNNIDIADLERYVSSTEQNIDPMTNVFVLRWSGPDSKLIPLSEIRNGDTLIVPPQWGGITNANWDPESTETVRDLGDWAQFRHAQNYHTTPSIRLSSYFGWPTNGLIPLSSDSEQGSITRSHLNDCLAEVNDHLKNLAAKNNNPELSQNQIEENDNLPLLTHDQREILKHFEANALILSERVDTDYDKNAVDLRSPTTSQPPPLAYYTLIGKALKKTDQTNTNNAQDQQNIISFQTDASDETSSLIGQDLTITEHSNDVAEIAVAYAKSLGLSEHYAKALRLAALFHDLGKADPRFQTILYGGDKIASAMASALKKEPLAKSKSSPKNGAHALTIFERSGYPKGTRHELMSLAFLETLPTNLIENLELIKHLVTTHHGMCRAIPPRQNESQSIELSSKAENFTMSANTNHGLDALSSGITDRFWTVIEQFGCHGLAWLETILRLADHQASAKRTLQLQSDKESDS